MKHKITMVGKALLLCGGLLLASPFQADAQKKGARLDMSNFDRSVRPQDDFYLFVNGGWMKKTEIPASEARWGSFNEIDQRNRELLKRILEEASAPNAKHPKGSPMQLIGDMYASAMDSVAIEKLGKKPIEADLAMIDGIKTKDDVLKAIADLQNRSVGTVLGTYVGADARNSRMNAVQMGAGGISLPSRSYYLESTPRMVAIRDAYMVHLGKMFELAGLSSEQAQRNAQIVFAMEKRLAEAQRTPVENRDPQKRYNKKSIADLKQMTFNIDWEQHLDRIGLGGTDSVIVGQPEFIAMVDRMLGDYTPEEWKAYFKWKVINSAAPFLSSDFVNENFNFFSTTLSGVKVMQPRWRRMLGVVNGSLGDALGQAYVAKAFSPEAKQRMNEMIENIREAMADRINSRDWMSETTKAEAHKKLNAIVSKIGYPDKWKDYAGVEIKRDDFYGNLRSVREYSRQEALARAGKPVDRSLWGMTPPTVNAYYSPINNEIAFPAGILQPPFFDPALDDAVNYGAIGGVIGHEISHGFDDQGSQYDADGNLKNWWTADDRKGFNERTQQLVKQFDGFTVLDSIHVNGRLTLGENIGDLGGLTIAYTALEKSWQKKGKPKAIDGFTPEQRFFIGWAMGWRSKYRDEAMMNMIKTDPHSPPYYRVNGPLSNMEAFFKAFDVKPGDKMYRPEAERVIIW